MTYRAGLEKEDAIVMVKKIIQELKWLALSAVLVALSIGTLYGIASFSQWKMEKNIERSIANGVTVNYTYWNEVPND